VLTLHKKMVPTQSQSRDHASGYAARRDDAHVNEPGMYASVNFSDKCNRYSKRKSAAAEIPRDSLCHGGRSYRNNGARVPFLFW